MAADRKLTAHPSLLHAKLRRPARPLHYIRRTRLHEYLETLVCSPVTVVVAPAGAGKTSLLAGWGAERDAPVAWLSLDETDYEPVQFWSGMITALETISFECGTRARAALRGPDGVDAAVRELLQVLDAVTPTEEQPRILVIDDLQCVADTPDEAEALGLFVRHLPAWLHVVLLSRHAPELPLDRLRARGQLGEMSFGELRFSSEEARQMLKRLAPALPEPQVDNAVRYADGLAVALQMTALKARAAGVITEAGVVADPDADSLLHGYVLHEVVAGESPELIDALLDVSVVERLDSEMARVLTGRADADVLLRQAEAHGLFVASVDDTGGFELHSLARAAFVTELERRSPGRLLEQHRRAACWFETVGELELALSHFFAAGLPREALRLLTAKQGELYDSGEAELIERTIARIPNDIATADLGSMLEFATCLLLIDRRRFLDAVERTTFWADRTHLEPLMRARLAVVQTRAAIVDGDLAESAIRAHVALDAFGDNWWCDPYGRFVWNNLAHEIAMSERWDDDLPEVHNARLSLSRDPDRGIAFEGTRALGAALAGRPLDALRTAVGIRDTIDVANMTILRSELALAEAMAHRELGDRGRAIAELTEISDTPAAPMLFCRILATLELAQLHFDDGALDSATGMLGRANDLVSGEAFGPAGRDWVARVATRLALARAEYEDAETLCERIGDPFWSAISTARVHLARGRREAAERALNGAAPRCVRHQVITSLLLATAAENPDDALAYAAHAVERASAHGMLQTVASEGRAVLELVERAAWNAPKPWLDRLRHAPTAPTGRFSITVDSMTPLTERELDVLRFLPSRLTLREIADELFISLNTLKFHLRMIYRKLDVASRADAVAKARDAGPRIRSTVG